VAISDGLVYACDLSGKVHCLDEKTGKPYWVYETGAETWSSPMVADGKIYIGTKKKLVTLAVGKQAKVLSEIPLGSAAYATPVAANGTLFVCSQSYLWAVQKGAKAAPVAAAVK
jgi:outer membrane protein assembly factor BamB